MLKYEDCYFSSFDDALLVAEQKNIIDTYGKLQICYYDGEYVETKIKNLIHLPINKICETLLRLNTRIPTKILHPRKNEIIKKIIQYEDRLEKEYRATTLSIKNFVLDFSEKLRVYIAAEYGSRVLLSVYEALTIALQKNNFEVLYEVNDEITLMNDFTRVKAIDKFKPHITININRLRNEYLNEETFNFIWFQDATLLLYDKSTLVHRKRDIFLYLEGEYKNALIKKGVPTSKLYYQRFGLDERYFYLKKNILRSNKIIFIGSNYFGLKGSLFAEYAQNSKLINKLKLHCQNNTMTREKLLKFAEEALINGEIRSIEHLTVFIYGAVVREEVVKWICSQKEIAVEIYGDGWEGIKEVEPFCKGSIAYGEDIADLYNSAKYCLVVNPQTYYQLRIVEASACGTIPIVYDSHTMTERFEHYEHALVFNDKKSLYKTLNTEPKKPPLKIAEDLRYNNIINLINKIIKERLGMNV